MGVHEFNSTIPYAKMRAAEVEAFLAGEMGFEFSRFAQVLWRRAVKNNLRPCVERK